MFHSYLPFLDFLNQVNMHFSKSDYVDLIETNFKFIHILSLVVVYWQALEKTWPKQVFWKLSSKLKASHFMMDFKTIVMAFKFDLSFLT